MNKNFLRVMVITLSMSIGLQSCASIFSKSSYPISITSIPVGADIRIMDKKGNKVYEGKSPATVTLKAGAGYFSKAYYTVNISSPGFADQSLPVKFKTDGWYWGNFFIGGLLGFLIIDPITGAMYKLKTPQVHADLSKIVVSTETPSLKIIDINTLSKETKEQLVQIN